MDGKQQWSTWGYFDHAEYAKEAAVDFRKLEAFLTVANTGKFVTAAEKLFISQSSLSKQMAQLERELDVKLFKKTRNGVELTQAGRDFYTYARKAVPDYQHELSRLKMYKKEYINMTKIHCGLHTMKKKTYMKNQKDQVLFQIIM